MAPQVVSLPVACPFGHNFHYCKVNNINWGFHSQTPFTLEELGTLPDIVLLGATKVTLRNNILSLTALARCTNVTDGRTEKRWHQPQ